MNIQVYLVAGWNGGTGRSLTAALLAFGLHLLGRRTVLVRQIHNDIRPVFDPIAMTLPLPCRDLLLPDRYILPPDLSAEAAATVHESDRRFADALRDLVTTEFGTDGDAVVDLCSHDRALNLATMQGATLILIPARASILEIDWAARGVAHIIELQRCRDVLVPALVAAIGPDDGRAQRTYRLQELIADYVADLDLEPTQHGAIIDAPFLDDRCLVNLMSQYEIWQNPDLQARCLDFTTAALAHALQSRMTECSIAEEATC